MLYVGIDAALTKTGIVVLDDDLRVIASHLVRPRDDAPAWARVLTHRDFMAQLLRDLPSETTLAAIEAYHSVRGKRGNAGTAHTLVEVGAAYRTALTDGGIPWCAVQPATWRKFVAGDGRAKKPQAVARVARRFGFKHPSEDVMEAFGVAAWLHQAVRVMGVADFGFNTGERAPLMGPRATKGGRDGSKRQARRAGRSRGGRRRQAAGSVSGRRQAGAATEQGEGALQG